MPLAPVGSLSTTQPSGGPTTTKSITTTGAGDLIVLYSLVLSPARTINSIAGGTADGPWSNLAVQVGGGTETIELWWAEAGTPDTDDAVITWSSTTAGMFLIHGVRQFTNGTGAGTTWAADGAGSGQANASDDVCAYPTKTPSGSDRLYVGYGAGLGGQALVAAGGTPGSATFQLDSFDNCFVFDTAVSALLSPESGTGNAQQSYSVGALLTATGGGPPPAVPRRPYQPLTARRRAANF